MKHIYTMLLLAVASILSAYAEAEVWQKVTTTPEDWSGTYLIVYQTNDKVIAMDCARSADATTGTLQGTNNGVEVTLGADGLIHTDFQINQFGDDPTCYVTIERIEGGYSIKTASGWYIGDTLDSNTIESSQSTPLLNTITLDPAQGILIAGKQGAVLRYNSLNNQQRFRYYKAATYTNMQPIALYSYAGKDIPTPTTVEVDYTITFNGQTIATDHKTENIGSQPTIELNNPSYVGTDGMTQTITAETTSLTIETFLNETAPFQVGHHYTINFVPNEHLYWIQDDYSGHPNELRRDEDEVSAEDLKDDARWTIGGDWLNGFTFQNRATKNYIAAGESHQNGNYLTMGDTPEAFILEQNENGFRLKTEDTYMAHVSTNTHIVSYWNANTYAGSYVYFTEYVEPSLWEAYQSLLTDCLKYMEDNQTEITDWDEDYYPIINTLAGNPGYKPYDELYNIVYAWDYEDAFLQQYPSTNAEEYNANMKAWYDAYETEYDWEAMGFDTPLEYAIDFIKEQIAAYEDASICLPELGKYYTIRNNDYTYNNVASFYLTLNNNQLDLEAYYSDLLNKIPTEVRSEHAWKVTDVEDNAVQFQNVYDDAYYLGNDNDSMGAIADNTAYWYIDTQKKNPVYGTLGLKYAPTRWAVMNLSGAFNRANDPYWSESYSSWYYVEEVNQDGTLTGVGTVLAPTTQHTSRIYNLQGQMHQNPLRGLHIQNGKKIIR